MNDSHPEDHLNSAASIFLSLWLSLSSFVAVSGNTVMLWLFYKNESLRTISNRFLASLSVADVLVGVVIDPVWIVNRCWIQPPLHSTLTDFGIALWFTQPPLLLSTFAVFQSTGLLRFGFLSVIRKL